jgi:hypothetical protein
VPIGDSDLSGVRSSDPTDLFVGPIPGLIVGATGDPAERAADRVADRAIGALFPSALPAPAMGFERLRSADRLRRAPVRPEVIGAAGGELGQALSARIERAHDGGRPLDPLVARRFSSAIGMDVSGARIHDDDTADRLARHMSAVAFTSPGHIFFSRGSYDPDSRGGARLLAHELAHVAQDGTRVRSPLARLRRTTGPIRRKIGFELEEGNWHPFEKVSDIPLAWQKNPGYQADEPGFGSMNVFARKGTTVDDDVAPFGVTSYTKKAALHQGDGFKLESDGPYTRGEMSIEFVSEPFDENEAGEKKLGKAFDQIGPIMKRLNKLGANPRSYSIGKFFGPGEHHLDNQTLLLAGGSPNTSFKMQVTHGVRLSDIPSMFETFGQGVAETSADAGARGPARALLATEPIQTTILGKAPGQARMVVDRLRERGVIVSKRSEDLVGFFTYVMAYLQWVQVLQMEGLKLALPFMSRYDFPRLLSMVPDEDQLAIRHVKNRWEVTDAVDRVLHKAGVLGGKEFGTPKSNQRTRPLCVNEPLMEYIHNPSLPDEKVELFTLLSRLTAGQWLHGVLDGQDRLTGPGLLKYLQERGGGSARQGARYEKSVKIFSRGHGASGTVVGGVEKLAVMENRMIEAEELQRHGGLDTEAARAVALAYLRYLRAVRVYGADFAVLERPTRK